MRIATIFILLLLGSVSWAARQYMTTDGMVDEYSFGQWQVGTARVDERGFSATPGSGYADSVDALLNPSPRGTTYKEIFSTYSPSDNNSVYNTNLWGGGGTVLDLTGIAWTHKNNGGSWDTTNIHCVAISKRLGIARVHNGGLLDPFVINELYFIAADGTRTVATIDARQTQVGQGSSGDNHVIVRFNSDLPAGIASYPILAGWRVYDYAAAEGAIVGTNVMNYYDGTPHGAPQGAPKLIVQEILGTAFNGWHGEGFKFGKSANTPRSLYGLDYYSGDSGSAQFVLTGTQLAYIASVVGASENRGAWCNVPEIKKACQELVEPLGGDWQQYMPTFSEFNTSKGARLRQVRTNNDNQ